MLGHVGNHTLNLGRNPLSSIRSASYSFKRKINWTLRIQRWNGDWPQCNRFYQSFDTFKIWWSKSTIPTLLEVIMAIWLIVVTVRQGNALEDANKRVPLWGSVLPLRGTFQTNDQMLKTTSISADQSSRLWKNQHTPKFWPLKVVMHQFLKSPVIFQGCTNVPISADHDVIPTSEKNK